MTVDDDKKALREQAQKSRNQAHEVGGADAVARFTDNICRLLTGRPAGVVSGYLEIGSEMNVRPALAALEDGGWQSALPVVLKAATPLEFRRWSPDDPLEDGVFNTRHPADSEATVAPDALLVPLLAFDRSGYRLGWGGGFYDRTLEKLRRGNPELLVVGVGYSAQEVDAVPRDKYDQRLNWVVTEAEMIRIDGP